MTIKFDLHWRREYSFYYGTATMYSLIYWRNRYLTDTAIVKGELKDGWFSCYSSGDTVDQLRKKMKRSVENNEHRKEIDYLNQVGREFVSYAQRVKYSAKTSLEQLKKYYAEYHQLIGKYGDCLWVGFYLPEQAGEVFQEFLKKNLPKNQVSEALEAYSVPSGKAMLFQIAEAFQKEPNEEKRIEIIKKKFPWIKTMDPFLKPANSSEIKEFVKSFSLQIKEAKDPFKLAKHPLTKMYQEMLYLKDLRDDYRRESFYHIHRLMIELAKRLNITLDDLSFMLPAELPLSEKELSLRKEACIAELNDGQLSILSGPEAIDNFAENNCVENNCAGNLNKKNDPQPQIVKGIIGFKGIVRGKVQIIKNREEVAKFKKGNILVAITTNPNHLPAMQKASAFVTDEGGITCHAAIVARELKKPCIVGTKIATKVLQDGDMVEVDANTGIVKKVTS